MRWRLAAVILAAVLAASAALHPVGTLVSVLAAGLLLLFAFRKKTAAATAIVAVLFIPSVERISGLSALGYVDEAIVLIALVIFTGDRLLKRLPVRAIPGQWAIIAYILIGGLSGIMRDVPFTLSAQSSFLMLKGFLFTFALAQLDWKADDLRRVLKPALIILATVLVAGAVNFLIPEQWTSLLSRRAHGIDYRYGLPSLIGPFDHEMFFGQFMALAAVAIFTFRYTIRSGASSTLIFATSLLAVLLSFRRKAMVAVGAALASVVLATPGKRLGAMVALVVVAPAALILSWDTISVVVNDTYIEYFQASGTVARIVMYLDSYHLAVAAFPFGVGFGRYGSYMASVVYSPEYRGLGYENLHGLGTGDLGLFLNDTFWPAILAESGFFGLTAFMIAVGMIAWHGISLSRISQDPYVKWFGILLFAWTVEFSVESIAAPVFNSPPLFPLLFGLAGIVTSLRSQSLARIEAVKSLAKET